MAKMYELEEALKIILEMKDFPRNSAGYDMKTDSCEDQSSQSDIVSADKDFPTVIAGPILRRGRGGVKVRGG